MESSAVCFCLEICDKERMENKVKLFVCEANRKKVKKQQCRAKGIRASENDCCKMKITEV